MFNISRAAEYAILFLVKLAKDPQKKPMGLKLAAQQTGLPYKFLSRIALDLKKAGLVKSKEGAGGGYKLSKDPKNISLVEIMKAVEGEKGLVSCIYGKCALNKACWHQKIWQKLQTKIEGEFRKIKLIDLIK